MKYNTKLQKQMTISVVFEEILDDDYEDGEDEYAPSASFVITADTMCAKYNCGQFGIKPENWEKLINAAETNSLYTLTFLDSNGYIGITTKSGMTIFCVSKHGGDNGGSIVVDIPNEHCLNAFRQAYQSLKSFYERKKE